MAKPRRTTKQSKQTGGTFLGIVLGLIVGLAIAVVVALYITRAPTPFVVEGRAARGARHRRERSAAIRSEPSAARQDAGPAGAASRATGAAEHRAGSDQRADAVGHAGRTADRRSAAVDGNANGTAVAPKPAQDNGTGTTATTGEEAAKLQRTGRHRGRLGAEEHVDARPPTPSRVRRGADAGDANTGYFLQVGAYKTQADAEQQRARLAFQGFESKVTQRDAGGVTYYRVRIGPFSKFEDMNSSRQRLSDAGVDTAVIRFTKQ